MCSSLKHSRSRSGLCTPFVMQEHARAHRAAHVRRLSLLVPNFAVLQALANSGYSSLPVPAAAEAWRSRAAWLHAAEVAATGSSTVPDLSAAALVGTLGSWLRPHLAGVRSRAQLQKLPWLDLFRGQVRLTGVCGQCVAVVVTRVDGWSC
jgi:hypothetical protein